MLSWNRIGLSTAGFLEGAEVSEDVVNEGDLGKGALPGGFEVGADLLGLTRGLDGLMDDGAGFEEVFDGGDLGLRAGQAEA